MPHPVLISCINLKHLHLQSNALSLTWITINAKRCPRCSSPIEKNSGCNHMTCRRCCNEFCWLCMSDWRGHIAENAACQASAQDFEKRRKISREQAESRSHFHQKFNQIYDNYVGNMKQIEKRRMEVFEKFEKTKAGLKMKEKARNFGNFIFGNKMKEFKINFFI